MWPGAPAASVPRSCSRRPLPSRRSPSPPGPTGAGAAGVVLGVDPQRFARIAAWRPGFATEPLATLAARLAPPAPPPVTVAGDAIRVTVTVLSISPARVELFADLNAGGETVPV